MKQFQTGRQERVTRQRLQVKEVAVTVCPASINCDLYLRRDEGQTACCNSGTMLKSGQIESEKKSTYAFTARSTSQSLVFSIYTIMFSNSHAKTLNAHTRPATLSLACVKFTNCEIAWRWLAVYDGISADETASRNFCFSVLGLE